MNRALLFLIILYLSHSHTLIGQSFSNSRVEQTKRLGRTNTHITKTYKGTIEKMLFSGHEYGGAFDGIVLKQKNKKLMMFRLVPFFGQSIGPHINEGQEVEIIASGDKELLNRMLYKYQYVFDLEKQLKGTIQGIGLLKQVQTSTGTYVAKQNEGAKFNTESTPILDIGISERSKIADNEGMLVLENDDTLIYQFTGKFENTLNQKTISYLRASKTGNGVYYNSANIYRMTSGDLKYSPEIAGNNTLQNFGFGNNFLRPSTVSSVKLIDGKDGLVNALVGMINSQKLDTFYFNSKSATNISRFISDINSDSFNVYYQEMPGKNILRAISDDSSQVLIKPLQVRYGPVEDYYNEKLSYQGRISKINYTKDLSKRFESLVLDDSVYIKLNQVIMLSLVDLVEEGSQLKIHGWRRKRMASEINNKGYTIIIPEYILINDMKFVNRASFN